jgi:hypothetical protein
MLSNAEADKVRSELSRIRARIEEIEREIKEADYEIARVRDEIGEENDLRCSRALGPGTGNCLNRGPFGSDCQGIGCNFLLFNVDQWTKRLILALMGDPSASIRVECSRGR